MFKGVHLFQTIILGIHLLVFSGGVLVRMNIPLMFKKSYPRGN